MKPMITWQHWLVLVLYLKLCSTVEAFLSKNLIGTSSPCCRKQWRSHQGTTLYHESPVSSGHEMVIDPVTVLGADVVTHISFLIQERAALRWQGDYVKADEFRTILDKVALPPHCRITIADNPRGVGGGSSWSLVYDVQVKDAGTERRPSVLNLAHRALGLAVSYAERGKQAPSHSLADAVTEAKEQLLMWKTVDSELRNYGEQGKAVVSFDKLVDSDLLSGWSAVESQLSGRKAADAAFWFAIAGVVDEELFALLARVCVKELRRFGDRPSCRPKDVLAIVERLAAAGVTGGVDNELENIVRHCLTTKCVQLSHPLFSLHSDYTAVMIWNFSTRQRKQKSFLSEAARHWENQETCGQYDDLTSKLPPTHELAALFEDPTKDLVIDIGCGMGLSLLGLASLNGSDAWDGFNWSECNFVGVDLSPLTVNYANGVAKRWAMSNRLVFLVDSADRFLEAVQSYGGSTKRILIQFPTPYRLQSSHDNGNSQLPKNANEGFMVTPLVLQLAASLLREPQGELVLQSNCEDVAVCMRQTAVQQAGFKSRDGEDMVREIKGMPTQRTLNWIASGGERAIGHGWCSGPVLPRTGRTETEIACIMNGTPVHRCVLIPAVSESVAV